MATPSISSKSSQTNWASHQPISYSATAQTKSSSSSATSSSTIQNPASSIHPLPLRNTQYAIRNTPPAPPSSSPNTASPSIRSSPPCSARNSSKFRRKIS